MFIDTHTHLFSTQFNEDVDVVIAKALEEKVLQCYLPNVDLASIPRMYELSDTYPDACRPMMGLHPCHVKENYQEVLAKMKIELDSERKFWAIGETGLDYHWDLSFVEQQKDALRTQIQWAKEYELPIVLHTRESFDDTYALIKELNDEKLTGVFHCFTGTKEEALKVMDLGGFYMGIGGVVTFKNSGVDKNLVDIPLDNLVLETDSPYLAPTPHRGKRNESGYIPIIAEKLAEVKGISLEEIANITTENAKKLYKA